MSSPLVKDPTITVHPAEALRFVLERREWHRSKAIRSEDLLRYPVSNEPRPSVAEIERFTLLSPDARTDATCTFLGALHGALTATRGDASTLSMWLSRRPQQSAARVILGVTESTDGAPTIRVASQAAGLGIRFCEAVQDYDHHVAGLGQSTGLLGFSILGIPGVEPSAIEPLDAILEAVREGWLDVAVIANPVPTWALDQTERVICELHNAARERARTQHSQGGSETESTNWSSALTEGVNWAYAASTSESLGVRSQVRTGFQMLGLAVGAGTFAYLTAGLAAPGAAALAALNLGPALGQMGGDFFSPQASKGSASTQTRGENRQRTLTEGKNHAVTVTKTQTVETFDRGAHEICDLLEAQLLRIRAARARGGWIVSCHALIDQSVGDQFAVVAGAIRGKASWLDSPRLVPLHESALPAIAADIRQMRSPLTNSRHLLLPSGNVLGTFLTTEEASRWFRPPGRFAPGLNVERSSHGLARFQDFRTKGQLAPAPKTLEIGMAHDQKLGLADQSVVVAQDDLTLHTLVVGATGSGKSHTIRQVISQVWSNGVPVLIIDPAKTDYREAGNLRLLRIESSVLNPFVAPQGITLSTHVEAILTLLKSCFDMHEALPEVLEALVWDGYRQRGWSPSDEVTEKSAASRGFPTFEDLVGPSPNVMDSVVQSLHYEERVKRNYGGALRSRLGRFLHGGRAGIFSPKTTQSPYESHLVQLLLDTPQAAVLELEALTDPDLKRVALGTILTYMQGHRLALRARRGSVNPKLPLQHLLVLEEAHHFLRRAEGSGPSVGLIRKSNEQIANAFAELRSDGQGILVADQSPSELDPAVIRNTNTKIVHRLIFEADARLISDSLGLSDLQRGVLRSLSPGECIVSTASAPEPVWCKVGRSGQVQETTS